MKETSMCMSEDYLAEIKARCEAATPGPWVDRLRDFECLDGYGLESHPTVETNGKTVCVLCEREFDDDNDEADAVFIAHARQDIPDLLAEVEHLRAREDWLVKQVAIQSNVYGEEPYCPMPGEHKCKMRKGCDLCGANLNARAECWRKAADMVTRGDSGEPRKGSREDDRR